MLVDAGMLVVVGTLVEVGTEVVTPYTVSPLLEEDGGSMQRLKRTIHKKIKVTSNMDFMIQNIFDKAIKK